MLFNSLTFVLAFLPVVSIGYFVLARRRDARAAIAWLLSASFVFYAWSNPRHLPFLVGSILFNHAIGRRLSASVGPVPRKRWLVAGLVGNVVFLAVVKYTRFVVANLALVMPLHVDAFALAFPLGASFWTLQQIMYLLDLYEEIAPPHSLLQHAAFTAFFPTITSGPITRAKQLVPQLERRATPDAEQVARGLTLLALGLAKKVIVADSFGRIADAGFSQVTALSGLEAWICSLAYTFQIYYDFSGYTDIARGSASFLGITLPINFNSPLRSRSVTEFWQRWHITLSQFITTYLYTPILRSAKKATLTTASIATLVAMTIAGLWHGPAWTFVAFGVLHGLGLVANQWWRKRIKRKLPPTLALLLTFGFVCLTFVCFRAPSLADAGHIYRALFWPTARFGVATLFGSIQAQQLAIAILPVLIGAWAAFVGPSSDEIAAQMKPTYRFAFGLSALVLGSFLLLNSTVAKDFIYFAF